MWRWEIYVYYRFFSFPILTTLFFYIFVNFTVALLALVSRRISSAEFPVLISNEFEAIKHVYYSIVANYTNFRMVILKFINIYFWSITLTTITIMAIKTIHLFTAL